MIVSLYHYYYRVSEDQKLSFSVVYRKGRKLELINKLSLKLLKSRKCLYVDCLSKSLSVNKTLIDCLTNKVRRTKLLINNRSVGGGKESSSAKEGPAMPLIKSIRESQN